MPKEAEKGHAPSSAISHVQTLPPEILAEIFQSFGPRKSRHYPFHWQTSLNGPVTLSHVCSSWRAIVLDIKSLWTVIPIVNEFWAELSLERSRPMPVIAFIPLDDRFDYEAGVSDLCDGIVKTLSESHRIRILEIEVSADESNGLCWLMERMFTSLEWCQLPILEHANIDLQWYDVHPRHRSFLGHTTPPNLRHLTLHSVDRSDLPCPHLLSAPLTYLELGYGEIWLSLEDALIALSRITTLEVLKLGRDRGRSGNEDPEEPGAIPYRNLSEPTLEARSIALPNLQLLELREPLEIIAYLMKYLSFPASARIKIETLNNPDEDGVVRSCIESLVRSLHAHYKPYVAEGRYFRGLLLDRNIWNGQRRLQVAGDHVLCSQDISTPRACYIPIKFFKGRRDPMRPHGLEIPFWMALTDDNTFSGLELAEMILNIPIFSSAHALTFTEEAPSSMDPHPFANVQLSEWRNVISRVDSISVAHFYGHTALHAVQALAEGDDTDYGRITELILQEVSFIPPPEDDEGKPAFIPFDTLVSMLDRRAGPGGMHTFAPLSHLELKACDVDETQLDHLRRTFGEGFVTWDGETRGTDESHSRVMRARMRSTTVEDVIRFIERQEANRGPRDVVSDSDSE